MPSMISLKSWGIFRMLLRRLERSCKRENPPTDAYVDVVAEADAVTEADISVVVTAETSCRPSTRLASGLRGRCNAVQRRLKDSERRDTLNIILSMRGGIEVGIDSRARELIL
jgi:hypothetical protein